MAVPLCSHGVGTRLPAGSPQEPAGFLLAGRALSSLPHQMPRRPNGVIGAESIERAAAAGGIEAAHIVAHPVFERRAPRQSGGHLKDEFFDRAWAARMQLATPPAWAHLFGGGHSQAASPRFMRAMTSSEMRFWPPMVTEGTSP
jgi:hypothetical protein